MEFRVPARVEALALVRSMAGSLAGYENLDGDTAADLTLALDEACTVLISVAAPGSDLVVVEDPGARELEIRASTIWDGVDIDRGSVFLSGFSRGVLEALTEKVETFVDEPALGIALTVPRRRVAAPG